MMELAVYQPFASIEEAVLTIVAGLVVGFYLGKLD